MAFPVHRPRRLRRSAALRKMVRETTLRPSDFVYPLFVIEGRGTRKPIASMPGVANLTIDLAVEEAKRAKALGIPSLILSESPPRRTPGAAAGSAPTASSSGR